MDIIEGLPGASGWVDFSGDSTYVTVSVAVKDNCLSESTELHSPKQA